MSEAVGDQKGERPALPRDNFRNQRIAGAGAPAPAPVVVTPDYLDTPLPPSPAGQEQRPPTRSGRTEQPRAGRAKLASRRNPFDAYGERSSSRPYALRLPDAIDLVLRQMAAEERTHPLRVVDRILHDHLKKIGRLPPPGGI